MRNFLGIMHLFNETAITLAIRREFRMLRETNSYQKYVQKYIP